MSKDLEALVDGKIEYYKATLSLAEGLGRLEDGRGLRETISHFEEIKKALTPPTEQEVCEHLNESFGLKRKNTNLHFIYDKESKEFRMVSQGVVYRYISTKRQSEDSIEFIDLDIDDIVILGLFYEGKVKE